MEFKSDVLGLALLGSISAFSIWSAANPSVFTISQFTTEQSKKNARLGMNIGLGLTGALSAGLYLAYGKKGTLPAALTGITGVGLYALYEYMLSGTHISNPDKKTMPQQFEAMQGGGGGGGQQWQLQPGFPTTAGGISNWSDSHPDWQFQITDIEPEGITGGGNGPAGATGPHGGGGGGGTCAEINGIRSCGRGGPGSFGYIYPPLPPSQWCLDHPDQPCPTLMFVDDYGNYYMSKAQVKASGLPQCTACLSHGRNLRDCSLLGECRGPWSDGATPDDLKQEQMRKLRLSGLGGGYYDYNIGGQPGQPGHICDEMGCRLGEPGQPGIGGQGGRGGDAFYDYGDDIVSYHAGSHPHGGKPYPVMASPVSQHRYHIDEGYSDYRGRY